MINIYNTLYNCMVGEHDREQTDPCAKYIDGEQTHANK